MRLKEIEVDSEFKDLVDHIKHLSKGYISDYDIQQILSSVDWVSVDEVGTTYTLFNNLREKNFFIPPMLVTTAIIAPELIKFKEKRNHWVLKSDFKMASLLEVDKEEYLSDKIFNYYEDIDSILMTDGNDMAGCYTTLFTRNELSEILESHNSELTVEDFMIYEGEDDEN